MSEPMRDISPTIREGVGPRALCHPTRHKYLSTNAKCRQRRYPCESSRYYFRSTRQKFRLTFENFYRQSGNVLDARRWPMNICKISTDIRGLSDDIERMSSSPQSGRCIDRGHGEHMFGDIVNTLSMVQGWQFEVDRADPLVAKIDVKQTVGCSRTQGHP